MSATDDTPPQSDSDATDDGEDDADHLFDDVRSHPRVCAYCLRLRHRETPVPHHVQALAARTYWADAVCPRWTRTKHVNSGASAIASDPVADRTPRTICECGEFASSDGGRWPTNDPFDTDTVIELTQHLDETLTELCDEQLALGDVDTAAQYAHDTDALFDAVRHLKSNPDRQFQDVKIFRVAVKVATDRGADDDALARRRRREVNAARSTATSD